MPNDLKCPECGTEDGPLEIEAVIYTTITLYKDGSEDDGYGETTWEDDSSCRCVECGFEGVVADFSPDKKAPTASSAANQNAQSPQSTYDSIMEHIRDMDMLDGDADDYYETYQDMGSMIVHLFEELDVALREGQPLPAAWSAKK